MHKFSLNDFIRPCSVCQSKIGIHLVYIQPFLDNENASSYVQGNVDNNLISFVVDITYNSGKNTLKINPKNHLTMVDDESILSKKLNMTFYCEKCKSGSYFNQIQFMKKYNKLYLKPLIISEEVFTFKECTVYLNYMENKTQIFTKKNLTNNVQEIILPLVDRFKIKSFEKFKNKIDNYLIFR